MQFSTFLTLASVASTTGWAAYVLEDDYMSGNFFDQFSFWDDEDPTHGFVEYVDQSTAQDTGLTTNDNGAYQMRVNHTAVQWNGRQSVRLTSNKSYQSGLIVIDVEHMPGGICGTWPAFWTVGPDWPNQGEIDIIEGVNNQAINDFTLHTGPGCSIGQSSAFTGTLESTTCESGGGSDNQGCQIQAKESNTYGPGFNENGGGVYAMDWTSESIQMYFFPRGSVPSDITSDSPNPESWGKPMAHFSGDCDISESFTNQQLVFDTTFCGDWAGSVWPGSTCESQMGCTCEEYVANNPEAFKEAYWSINALKVYQQGAGDSEPSSAPSAPAPSSYAPPISEPSAAPSAPVSSAPVYSVPAPPSYAPPAPPSSFQTVSIPVSSDEDGWAPTVGSTGGIIGSAPITSYAPIPIPSIPAVAPPQPPLPPPPPPPAPQAPPVFPSPPSPSGVYAGYHENKNDAYVVGFPVKNYRQHARHLRAHKMHAAGGH